MKISDGTSPQFSLKNLQDSTTEPRARMAGTLLSLLVLLPLPPREEGETPQVGGGSVEASNPSLQVESHGSFCEVQVF